MIDYKDPKFQAWLRRVHQHCGNLTWNEGFSSESYITNLFSKHMNTLWGMYQKRDGASFAASSFLNKHYPTDWVRAHSSVHNDEMIARSQGKAMPRAERVPRRQSYANIGREYLDIVMPISTKKLQERKQKFGKVVRWSDKNK